MPETHTISTSSPFEALLNAALAKNIEETGKDLRNHPLANQIDACTTPESLLALFQEQAQTFDEFRNGNHKLIKWLQPIINHLHTLSTSPILSRSVSAVSPYRADVLLFCLFFNVLTNLVAISSCDSDLDWNQHPPFRAYLRSYTASSYSLPDIVISLDGQVCESELQCPRGCLRNHRELSQENHDIHRDSVDSCDDRNARQDYGRAVRCPRSRD